MTARTRPGRIRSSVRSVVAGALVTALVAACLGSAPPVTPGGSGTVSGAAGSQGASGDPTVSAAPIPRPEPGHEVYGFVPYWEMDEGIADHIAATDLTTLALFSVTHRRSGELAANQNGYRRITGPVGRRVVEVAHEHDVRVELVYTSFGADKNRAFYDRPESQERWIRELVEVVVDEGLDGVNVDVELLPLDLVPAYGEFVRRLRAALVERSPDAQVSVATQANEVGAAMAVAASQAGADRVFLMGYDYHWSGSSPGASAPIDRLDGEPKDLVWSLDLYEALGVPLERTLLGLPLYGMRWPVSGPGLGSPGTGRGEDWVPRRNLRVLDDPSFEPTYDPIQSVEFYAVPVADDGDEDGQDPSAEGSGTDEPPGSSAADTGRWDAVYYDSPRSLAPKLALADARGLAGAGFWAIGYERGLPEYTDLISRFRAGGLEGG